MVLVERVLCTQCCSGHLYAEVRSLPLKALAICSFARRNNAHTSEIHGRATEDPLPRPKHKETSLSQKPLPSNKMAYQQVSEAPTLSGGTSSVPNEVRGDCSPVNRRAGYRCCVGGRRCRNKTQKRCSLFDSTFSNSILFGCRRGYRHDLGTVPLHGHFLGTQSESTGSTNSRLPHRETDAAVPGGVTGSEKGEPVSGYLFERK